MAYFKASGKVNPADRIREAREHLESAIEEIEKFMEEAKPQTSEAAENFYAINQVAEQLQAFLDKHESLFDEIIGG